MKLLTTEIVTRMKQIGKLILFLVFLLSIHSSYSQCITIADLSYLFEGDFSSINESTYGNNGQSEKLNFKGYNFSYQTDSYYFNNGDYLNLNSGDFLILTLSNSSCYSKIKASVAKESNSKVSSKEIYSLNGLEIEKYRHLSKDLIIEFQKNTLENKYFVVLMTSSVSDLMSSLIVQTIKRLEIEKRIADKISNVRKMIASNDIIKADLLLTEAVNYTDLNNLNQEYDRELQQLKNEIVNIRFKAISKSFQEKMKLNKFLEANEILKGSKNIADNSISNQINQYQADLNSKAITFYTEKYKEKKESKNYTTAISYLDSIVLFDPTNKWVSNDKKELLSINTFLQERKTTEFDFWALNKNVKESLINDYKTKSNSLINKKAGNAAFDLDIKTDTSCQVFTTINWRSESYESISFGKNEQTLYSVKPYEKFGYCGKSSGTLSFDLSWATTTHVIKYGYNRGSNVSESNFAVDSYLEKKYPLINGRYKYSKSKVNFNNNVSEKIQLTDFHTRGPANALFSFVMPGSGSLMVSYGKKGWARFTWFLISSSIGIGTKYYSNTQYKNYLGATNQTDIDKYYSNANIFHKIAIVSGGISASIYIYDIIWAFSKGCKNINVSKHIRKQLNRGPIVIEH